MLQDREDELSMRK